LFIPMFISPSPSPFILLSLLSNPFWVANYPTLYYLSISASHTSNDVVFHNNGL
jgi:hypothetical protein